MTRRTGLWYAPLDAYEWASSDSVSGSGRLHRLASGRTAAERGTRGHRPRHARRQAGRHPAASPLPLGPRRHRRPLVRSRCRRGGLRTGHRPDRLRQSRALCPHAARDLPAQLHGEPAHRRGLRAPRPAPDPVLLVRGLRQEYRRCGRRCAQGSRGSAPRHLQRGYQPDDHGARRQAPLDLRLGQGAARARAARLRVGGSTRLHDRAPLQLHRPAHRLPALRAGGRPAAGLLLLHGGAPDRRLDAARRRRTAAPDLHLHRRRHRLPRAHRRPAGGRPPPDLQRWRPRQRDQHSRSGGTHARHLRHALPPARPAAGHDRRDLRPRLLRRGLRRLRPPHSRHRQGADAPRLATAATAAR